MRFFTDLRRGLLAASSLATLQVALPAHAQQYPAYPQTAQPYAQAAGQNPYAALPQPAAQPYAATQPAPTVATQPVAPTAPYQQFSAARQHATVATQQATQQYNAGVQQVGQVGQQVNQQYTAATQQAAAQYNAAVPYVASRPTTAVTPTVAYPTAPLQQPAVQAAPQMSAFQQVYPNAAPPVAPQQPVYQQPVYTARAMQNPAPEAVQNLPLNPPTEAVPPGAVMPQAAGVAPQPVPMPEGSYPQAGGYESYPSGYGRTSSSPAPTSILATRGALSSASVAPLAASPILAAAVLAARHGASRASTGNCSKTTSPPTTCRACRGTTR